ncbi:MAG: asparaginase, partial [Planctomycetes bacterium]|nr:asparaginase [Planctomycetota bacterium]
MRSRVAIIHVGGTVGMARGDAGYTTRNGHLQEQLAAMDIFRRPELPVFELIEYDELLDSADMMPQDWAKLAEDIVTRHDDFDGFVVLHGTDTMAYTASALSFMLENLAKPVVLTGSQIPLYELRSDAASNLLDALMIAGTSAIPEVLILFGGQLLRGNRATKVSASGFEAFASPNFLPLGRTGVQIEIRNRLLRPVPTEALVLHTMGDDVVASLRLFPGIDARVLEPFLASPLRGLVLEAYGIGNGPKRNVKVMDAIHQATTQGMVVVVTSQCREARVDLG